MPCPAGLVYNAQNNWCQYPQTSTILGSTPPPSSYCANRSNGNYVNPNDIHSYIACSGSLTYVMPCPAGLVYNGPRDMCDWPSVSGNTYCAGQANGIVPHRTKQDSFICCYNQWDYGFSCQTGYVYYYYTNTCQNPGSTLCTGKPNGNYVNPSNIYSFITCSNQIPYVMSCPAGLVYNFALNMCDWPASRENICTKNGDGNYRNLADASSYISCSNGIPNVMKCPANLVFNDKGYCDWPVTNNFCSSRKDGNYANALSDTTYIACSNQNAYVMPCPSNLIYNAYKDQCDWSVSSTNPCNGYCHGRPNGHYSNLYNPTGYVVCYDGLTYVQSCNAGLVYDATSNQCNWPARPVSSIYSFCSARANGNYANSADYSSYISCSNELTYIMPCPAGLIYNPVKDQCDWTGPFYTGCSYCSDKSNGRYIHPIREDSYFSCINQNSYVISCPNGVTYDSNTQWCAPQGRSGSATFCVGKQDGNYANPSNSSTYIACSNQYTYVMPCYPGLVYNAAKDWCDWPSASATSVSSSCGCQISTSFCRTNVNGNYANPSCSRSFIMCSNGLTYIMPCPSNLIFNDIYKVCVFPPGSP
ncbi:chondroitin proteoglycan 2-like isoform X2 [Erpetoichthys calabaricus]|uniref:chondroitin proteoglycan 2-like isoform X2 n=1 Tax=Erpetoichthys calabaricus TaxID=27687 RepID=UPI0022340E28|nr:chondroitin proteoglycan 2-like isoform X2 [Erpetoichthys calabaricus]